MEIIKEVTIKLTPNDIKELIIDLAYKNGVAISSSSISFQINQHFIGEADLKEYTFDGALCKGQEIINPNHL